MKFYRYANALETELILSDYEIEGAATLVPGGEILVPESTPVHNLCSANVGGDPASGCDEIVIGKDYCAKHEHAAESMTIPEE